MIPCDDRRAAAACKRHVCMQQQPLCHHMAAVALQLRCSCAAVALQLRCSCVAVALQLHCCCVAVVALQLRCIATKGQETRVGDDETNMPADFQSP